MAAALCSATVREITATINATVPRSMASEKMEFRAAVTRSARGSSLKRCARSIIPRRINSRAIAKSIYDWPGTRPYYRYNTSFPSILPPDAALAILCAPASRRKRILLVLLRARIGSGLNQSALITVFPGFRISTMK